MRTVTRLKSLVAAAFRGLTLTRLAGARSIALALVLRNCGVVARTSTAICPTGLANINQGICQHVRHIQYLPR